MPCQPNFLSPTAFKGRSVQTWNILEPWIFAGSTQSECKRVRLCVGFEPSFDDP